MMSGLMDGSLKGYEGCATIFIDYEFPGGTQVGLIMLNKLSIILCVSFSRTLHFET
jgi:hypothetical protein